MEVNGVQLIGYKHSSKYLLCSESNSYSFVTQLYF